MTPTITAYPLSWPPGWPRTNASDRRYDKFGRRERGANEAYSSLRALSVSDGVSRVFQQLVKMGVERETIVISTNIEARLDGLPRSDRAPTGGDPGVAVYWQNPDTNQAQCMAIDLYMTVAGNLAAVSATIEAMRAIERHGGAQVLKRAFEGFKALPAAGATISTLSTKQAAYAVARLAHDPAPDGASEALLANRDVAGHMLKIAKGKTHPDKGGRNEDWTLLQEAERIITAHHGGKL